MGVSSVGSGHVVGSLRQRYDPLKFATRNTVATSKPPRVLREPVVSIPDTVLKAALEQTNKRIDAQLATKTATEARALALVGHCMTVLGAVGAAGLVELYGQHRFPLLMAASTAVIILFAAVVSAYLAVMPRFVTLPGRLPSDMWDDIVDGELPEAQFLERLIAGFQSPMIDNEHAQLKRSRSLRRGLLLALSAVPASLLMAAVSDPSQTIIAWSAAVKAVIAVSG
jgi:hypothetical protein